MKQLIGLHEFAHSTTLLKCMHIDIDQTKILGLIYIYIWIKHEISFLIQIKNCQSEVFNYINSY